MVDDATLLRLLSDLRNAIRVEGERTRAELRRVVGASRQCDPDLLARFLSEAYAFAGQGLHDDNQKWTAAELMAEARATQSGALVDAIEEITGGVGGEAAKRLGIWLARHEGLEAGGFRLARMARAGGTWRYRVDLVECDP